MDSNLRMHPTCDKVSSIAPHQYFSNRTKQRKNSILIIISTALVTWIVSIFYHSHYHFASSIDNILVSHLPLHRWVTNSKEGNNISIDQFKVEKARIENDNHYTTDGAQGGNGFTNVHQHNFINMESYHGPSTVWKQIDDPQKRHWCVPSGMEQHFLTTPAHEGFLFQRPVKTGSTTLTAIMLRMVERYSTNYKSRCKYRAMHETSRKLEFGQRDRSKSYLWSVIRDPTRKAISRYFHFDVSIGQKAPTDEHFRMIMKRPYNRNDLTQQLIFSNKYESFLLQTEVTNVVLNSIVQEILDGYDFIAVTERMDESLVVFMILMGLDFYDILYIKARSSGTFSNGPGDGNRDCVYLIPSFLTPSMSEFFQSEEWKSSNAIDIQLYQAVYKSLDNTINFLGEKHIQLALEKFHSLQQEAISYCESRIRSICSEGGYLNARVNRTCIMWGEGCDFECLNEFRRFKENLL